MYELMPYPYSCDGQLESGWMVSVPDSCMRCVGKPCLEAAADSLSLCSYGFHFIRINSESVILGLVLEDAPVVCIPQRKNKKKFKHCSVASEAVLSFVGALRKVFDRNRSESEKEKEALRQEFAKGEMFKEDFLSQFRGEIEQGLSAVHDYRQINKQISQNINIIIESRNGEEFDKKLEDASHQERAIYYASKFLNEKLNVSKFLMYPEWLLKADECVFTRPHGLVVKYVRIYEGHFQSKNLNMVIAGNSHEEIYANPQAVAVIPHTLIDNAVKYAKKGDKIVVELSDNEDGVMLSVTSSGPKIHVDESDKIFHAFYRGRNAKRLAEEGSGYGLYISQLIAVRHLGSQIHVEQSSDQNANFGYLTTFSINLPYRAKIA